jgi:hypothetical protein
VKRLAEVVSIVLAGAVGSTLAVLTVGASLLFVLPVALGIGAIVLAAGHHPRSRSRGDDREPQNA